MVTSLSQPGAGPLRGDIWLVKLEPVIGHEQGGTRPAVVVSANPFNRSRSGLVMVAPMTTVFKGIPWNVQVSPPEGGIQHTSYVKCEDLRSVSTERLVRRFGTLSAETLASVAKTIQILLDL